MRFLRHITPLLVLLVLPQAARAELSARLVRDIDPTSYAGSSSPRQRAEFNRGFAFTAFNGTELWTYDDTEDAFARVLKLPEIRQVSGSIYAARASSGRWLFWNVLGWPYFQVEAASTTPLIRLGAAYPGDPFLGGLLLFEADAGKGLGLWTLRDGDVKELARPLPLAGGRLLHDPTVYRSRTFFVARDRRLGTALWVTDGTLAGTSPLFAPAPGKTVSMILAGAVRDRLLLAVSGSGAGDSPALWLSDGTPRGTRLLTVIGHGPGAAITDAFQLAAVGLPSRVFLIADDGHHGRQLWTTNGTAAGTVPLTRFTASDPFGPSRPAFASLNGRWVFFADDGSHGRELWWSDGTAAGTEILADTCPGPCGTPGTVLGTVRVNESDPQRLLFSAREPGKGVELWSTDGTSGHTLMISDLCDGRCNGDPRDLTVTYFLDRGYFAVFTAATPEGTRALWISDGTTEGTERLTPPGVTVTHWGDGLFTASDAAFGDEFWTTDGTPETTHLWKDLGREEDSGSYPVPLGSAGDRLIFSASDPAHGRQLWASDGTAPRTVRVPLPHPAPQVARGVLAATAGGRTLFAAPAHGSPDNLLWATEGTAAGTLRLTPPGVTVYGSLLAASQRVFFFATDAEHGTELWASDGTPASTHLVADLAPGPESVQADFNTLTVLRGQVIFRRLDDDTHFWTTDGTAAGTRRLIDVYPFLDSFEGEYFPVFAESSGILFFVPSHGEDHPHEVWVSDWTSEGTHLLGRPDTAVSVIAIFSAGSRLFVGTAPTRTNDVEPAGLWVQNGSPTGFVRVPATVSFHLGTTPIAFGDRLVFADGSEKISVTDGSPAGTFPLLDPAGEEISLGGVGHVASFAGSLVFAGNDPGPCTIWDGTGNVAAPAADVQCGGGFFPVGSRLFFTGIAPQTGAELWAFEEP